MNLEQLDAWDADNGTLTVVVETAKGSRNKLKYEPKFGTFRLKKVLPSGMIFPYDFGFIPSTLGEDGDPLDVMVLMDEPTVAGCLIPCRLIGVIEAEEKEDGKRIRNDRLVAVAAPDPDKKGDESMYELDDHLVKEIEHFFSAYNDLSGKEYRTLGTRGPKKATKLVYDAENRFKATPRE